MSAETKTFHAGYLIAVANIVNLHGEDTIAEDVLRELGVDESALRPLGLSDYDAKPLRRLFREIKRKAGITPFRSRTNREPTS